MMRSHSLRSVFVMACVLIFTAGRAGDKNSPHVSGATTNDIYHPFLINNVFNYYGNNGDGSFNKFSSSGEGFEFYKGTGKWTIFEDGIVWGGFHKGRTSPTVGGSVYKHGLQAGPILIYGTTSTAPVAGDPVDPGYRIYRVRPDVSPRDSFNLVEGTLTSSEVNSISRYETVTARQIYDQYIADWNEWPADLGAPFAYGLDTNGVKRATPAAYDPRYDTPGYPGANQTLWYVANDCDASRVGALSGSPTIGLEMRRTIWGYNKPGVLNTTIFTSTVLINKSGAKVDSMYVAQWSDPDLGYAGDDFVGCDSAASLGFCYNGQPTDATYGTAVPAVGYVICQGPEIWTGRSDTATFLGRTVPGVANLRMSAFSMFTQGNVTYADPTQGAGGDVEWFRLLHGTIAKTGVPFIDPTTNAPTKFVMSGVPATGSGWLDGAPLSPGDRRMVLTTGPFTFAAGDTQEVVVALYGALGSDRLTSTSILKSSAETVRAAFKATIVPGNPLSVAEPTSSAPTSFTLEQNYPNPFNPTTTMRYSVPQRSMVRLAVYDILGREVAMLVNGEQEMGSKEITFDGSRLASGVYFYRLQAAGYTWTKRLILIK